MMLQTYAYRMLQMDFSSANNSLGYMWSDLLSTSANYIEDFMTYLYVNYVDVTWILWIFYPVVVTFLLPVVIVLFIYMSVLILQLYRLRRYLFEAYRMDMWDGARQIVSTLWDAQGKIWHGYEINGFEKIPAEGAALIVYYHGALPIDFYYLMAQTILVKKRQIQAIGDRFLFKIPGFKLLMEVFCVTPGTVTSCVELLNQSHLMAIAPGGVREAQFGDNCYELMWGNRIGFAKIAVDAKVPVIPVFTQNLRETFRSLSIMKGFFRWLYETTRLPLVPIYGGFPVKLRTHIGDPIPYDPVRTPEQLASLVRQSINDLIRRHQRIPGNILCALYDRLDWITPYLVRPP